MATTLYFTDVVSDLNVDGTTEYEAWTTSGDSSSAVSNNAPSVNSSAKSYIDDANGTITWYSKPLQAVTISGTITFNLYAGESSMSANQQIGLIIDRVNSSGTYQSTIYDGTRGAELFTGSTLNTWSATPTSTSMSNGDRIRIRIYCTQYGSGATGYTVSFYYDYLSGVCTTVYTETLAEYTGGGATTYHGYAQSQAWIEQTYNQFSQAQTWIESTYNAFAQVQTRISGPATTVTQVSQTRTWIKTTYPRSFNYSQTILNDSPVAYWRLGESNGNPQDSAGTNHVQGTLGTPAPTYSATGALIGDSNTACGFGGGGYFYTLDQEAVNLEDLFTLEAWVYLATSNASGGIVAKGSAGGGAGAYAIKLLNGSLVLDCDMNWTIVTSTQACGTGWHHVVATKNGSSVYLYIDGKDRTGTISNYTCTNTTQPVFIGARHWGNDPLTGNLDEVALYNKVLTPEQVTVHYIAGTWGATFAQTQAQIITGGPVTTNQSGQAQARIKSIYQAFAQSQSGLKQTYFSYVQANALIGIIVHSHAQVNAQIKTTYKTYSQAQAQISAAIVTKTSYAQVQAQIYIPNLLLPIADITVNDWLGIVI